MVTVSPRATSSTARIVLRVLGVVLLLAGLYLVIRGGTAFADQMDSSSAFDDDSAGFGPVLMIGGGGFLFVFGVGALNAGFLGAQARYASGQVAPAVRELGGAFRGDPADTRSSSSSLTTPPAAGKSGPFCSSCGVRADGEARFCDACGHAIAPR